MRKLIFILLVLSVSLMGQSAYYRLGYGDLYPTTDPIGSSLGNGAVALKDSVHVTIHNPAALNHLTRVYFGVVLGSEFRSVSESMSNNTRLEQLKFATPIGKNIGMSFGVRAISDFVSLYEVETVDGTFSESSEGGIWDYQLGLGYAPTNNLSVGLKLHLLHGFLRREANVATDGGDMYVVRGDISGRSLELGAISHFGDKVSLGLTLDLPYKTPTFYGVDSIAGSLESNEFEEELSAWPTSVKLGLVYHHSKNTKILAGIEQQMFPASGTDQARVFALPSGWETNPVASFQLALQRIASDRTSRNWVKRTGWQAGFSVKNYYLVSSTETFIYEYALISGLNLGLRNGRSLFDISGEFGSRGGEESLPDELFARIKFGIQVNDIWFRKAKRR